MADVGREGSPNERKDFIRQFGLTQLEGSQASNKNVIH